MDDAKKYIIEIDPAKENSDRVREIAEATLAEQPQEIRNQVEFRYNPFAVRDYGVNPIADRDYRSFVDLISPKGQSMLPLSDIALRRCVSETEDFVKWCINKIKKDSQSQPAP